MPIYTASKHHKGYVQKGIELENGKEYLIKVYSTEYVPSVDIAERYFLTIGIPYIAEYDEYEMDYRPSQAYYVPADTTKTFYINVSDNAIPNSARASNLTDVHFSTGRTTESVYITLCTVTSPNGKTFTLKNGHFREFEKISPVNYLENFDSVSIKGTWKVTVRTSKSMNLYFKIIGFCDCIMGHYGN